ncbi:MAG TPA: phenylalanine--tRNA ligase subunit beta [Bacteroidales bacterium]|nr:phenylalanine--tRNA ligase subunit beta [Bacteroidales bacterium]HPT09073.1 phenylalanine--tRNA ligase subunit beta [Bacteroidales bacterium]
MKISYNWLKLYLDFDLPPDKVAEYLTGCGLEIEGIETFHSVKGGLQGVVTGEVLTCEKHPNSDHLSITTVDTGQEKPLSIVCGAPNVAVGQKVAVALIGTTLYLGDKPLTLQKTKIRGAVSEGMICAEDELGLGSSHNGIMVLDPSVKPGTPAASYFNVEEDVVFTIGLTPNRTDATSHFGVARDLAAVINNFGCNKLEETRELIPVPPDVSAFKILNNNRFIDVVIETPEGCPRYSGITVSGIKVKESPAWLRNKLNAIGLRPINNVVDVTNFILMEMGQPLHVFDCDQIIGDQIIIKNYPRGTRFTTLDHVERVLTGNEVMICNTVEPMVIGGVYGGLKSGVSMETTSVFIESACFNPRSIRKTARHHGLQTDASFRFERGTDYNLTLFALKRAALMIRELAGGEISSEIVDVYPTPVPPQEVTLSYGNMDRLIGKVLDRKVVKKILKEVGIILIRELTDPQGLLLSIPAFKTDVTREVDVIEEILRIYGYNNIEFPPDVRASLSFYAHPDPEKIRNSVSEFLSARGFHEIMNNSLTRSVNYENNPAFDLSRAVRIMNPVSRDLDVMRLSLLHGALESLVYNQNRKLYDLRFYEFGTVYALSDEGILPGYTEEQHFSLLLTGCRTTENWNTPEQPVDVFLLKEYVEALFKKISLDPDTFTMEPDHSGLFTNGIRYFDREELGVMGQLHPDLLRSMDAKNQVFYAEFNWDRILERIPKHNARFRELPKFPEVRRDLALVLDQAITFMQLKTTAFATEKKLLRSIGLFDVYEGEQVGPGKKSYALKFILQDEEKTLTDKEIDKVMERLIKAFIHDFDARVR